MHANPGYLAATLNNSLSARLVQLGLLQVSVHLFWTRFNDQARE